MDAILECCTFYESKESKQDAWSYIDDIYFFFEEQI